MTPGVGEVLAGKYQVERLLGEGGFGVVVAAMHLQLRQRVALKFLLPHALRERAIVERFLREAQAMAGIKSQHVARVIDVGSLPAGAPYIVMEYLEGENLADIVASHGPMPVGVAASAVLEACEAIAEAHSLGIVHRDLKPANLFRAMGTGGVPIVKVLDFGISKLSFEAHNVALTKSHAILGTPLYASPEQLRSTKHVDHRSDIWSIGATMYHLVSGSVPFPGENVADLAIKAAMDPTPPLPAHLKIPRDFEAIIRRCLEKDPAARFQSVGELAAALTARGEWIDETVVRRISKSLGLPVSGSKRRGTVPPRVTTTLRSSAGQVTLDGEAPRRRSGKLPIALAVAVLASAIGAGAVVFRGGSTEIKRGGVTGADAGVIAATEPPAPSALEPPAPAAPSPAPSPPELSPPEPSPPEPSPPAPAPVVPAATPAPVAPDAAPPPPPVTAEPATPEPVAEPVALVEIALEIEPAGAAVTLDGRRVLGNPLKVSRSSDVVHTVVVSAPGFVRQTHEVRANESTRLSVRLKKAPVARSAPPPQPAPATSPPPAPKPAAKEKVKILGPVEDKL